MSASAQQVDEMDDEDAFTDVEDFVLNSSIGPGQQTPTATNQHQTIATPKASQRSVSSDNVRRFAWTSKHDPSSSVRRPRFASHSSFQEVRYRKNGVYPSDTVERDHYRGSLPTKGLAPRSIDFVTQDGRRKSDRNVPSDRPPIYMTSSLNRYSLLDSLAAMDADFRRPRKRISSDREPDFPTTSTTTTLHSPPPMTRRTTYSSLPPSPSALSRSEFEVDVSGPRSATEVSSYLDTYDQLDQEAFAKALQRALETKADNGGVGGDDSGEMKERRPSGVNRAMSLPPEDVLTDGFAISLPALDERLVASAKSMSNKHVAEPTMHPLWQMITEEMNVEQNRLFVIEGKCPILRSLLVIIPTIVLSMTTDVSKMYHKVRGQDTIKLYVIYNALEIADKLCSAFGQDILDTLFSKETLEAAWWSETVNNQHESKRRRRRKRERATPFFFFMLGLAYVHIHALVYFYQLVALNVAVNSYDNALLTLLVSNQFVEIKGSVFKKFEKENLLQIMCADIVERFQLGLMLSVIALRNMIEMSGSEIAFLPKSFVKGKSLLDTILSPVLIVILSEMAVDWLKHAFITKFNHIRSSVYDRYLDVLCKDVVLAGRTRQSVSSKTRNLLTDHTLLLGRRLGFASLPLSCLLLRVGVQAIGMTLPFSFSGNDDETQETTPIISLQLFKWVGIPLIGALIWLSLTALKILLGTVLSTFAIQRQADMAFREQQDQVNSFGRKPIAENVQEEAYGQEVQSHLGNKADDIPLYDPVMGTTMAADPPNDKKVGKPKWKLEEVESMLRNRSLKLYERTCFPLFVFPIMMHADQQNRNSDTPAFAADAQHGQKQEEYPLPPQSAHPAVIQTQRGGLQELLEALRDALKDDSQTMAFKQFSRVQEQVQAQQVTQPDMKSRPMLMPSRGKRMLSF
ncbi:hypothetical protein QFC19_000081 [Naganishia cerealis]|uniref:Uncharacterized protein n=1 Tax=Naganishia cerealis TaxID=610337 RepID=A0ACC2WQG2_9TREE|nr:hypothetical protein QFC19_000081 [Naganishia cerealis]